jgi:hypothetical protein
MERNNGLGNEMELLWLLACGYICAWIIAVKAKWNDWVDLWRGMKKPLMPCGAEVGEMKQT